MKPDTTHKSQEANRIIDALGGTSVAAEIFEVTTGGVSQWRKTGIPKTQLKFIRLLRPDLFSDEPSSAPRSPGRREGDGISGRRKLTGASK